MESAIGRVAAVPLDAATDWREYNIAPSLAWSVSSALAGQSRNYSANGQRTGPRPDGKIDIKHC
jgi:hypothetical protein